MTSFYEIEQPLLVMCYLKMVASLLLPPLPYRHLSCPGPPTYVLNPPSSFMTKQVQEGQDVHKKLLGP